MSVLAFAQASVTVRPALAAVEALGVVLPERTCASARSTARGQRGSGEEGERRSGTAASGGGKTSGAILCCEWGRVAGADRPEL